MVICVTDMQMITLLPQPNFLWWQHIYLRNCHSDRIIYKCYLCSSYFRKTRDLTICDLKRVKIMVLFIFFVLSYPAMAERKKYIVFKY